MQIVLLCFIASSLSYAQAQNSPNALEPPNLESSLPAPWAVPSTLDFTGEEQDLQDPNHQVHDAEVVPFQITDSVEHYEERPLESVQHSGTQSPFLTFGSSDDRLHAQLLENGEVHRQARNGATSNVEIASEIGIPTTPTILLDNDFNRETQPLKDQENKETELLLGKPSQYSEQQVTQKSSVTKSELEHTSTEVISIEEELTNPVFLPEPEIVENALEEGSNYPVLEENKITEKALVNVLTVEEHLNTGNGHSVEDSDKRPIQDKESNESKQFATEKNTLEESGIRTTKNSLNNYHTASSLHYTQNPSQSFQNQQLNNGLLGNSGPVTHGLIQDNNRISSQAVPSLENAHYWKGNNPAGTIGSNNW